MLETGAMNKTARLRQVDFLKAIPEDTLEQLAQCSGMLSLKPGDCVFREGDEPDAMYIVFSGEFEVTKDEVVIAKRKSGEYFGEMALIESKPRSATIKAISDADLMVITRKDFKSKLSASPEAAMSLARTLSERMRDEMSALTQSHGEARKHEKYSQRLARILDESINEVYTFDPDSHRFIMANQIACNNLGYSLEELTCLKPLAIWKTFSREDFKDIIDSLRSGKTALSKFETVNRKKDGTTYPVELRLQVLDDDGKQHIAATVQDISERKKLEGKVEKMAYTDELTGLPNRNLLVDRLKQSIAYAERNGTLVAVLLMDMDNFKHINDVMGHAGGDQLLRAVARRLENLLRKQDSITRVGGDEFVVLLPEVVEEQSIMTIAEKVLNVFNSPFKIQNQEIFVTFSIGVACYPKDGEDPALLLKNADMAMFQSKAEGKNRIQRFHSSFQDKSKEKLSMDYGIRKALEENQFVLHYQPKVNMKTGQIVGAEALIRWNHPDQGMISPGVFIPAAEENRLIVKIGEWVLKTACQQLKVWDSMGLPIPNLAVNLSGHQFNQKDIARKIGDVAQSQGVHPGSLEMELTESILMENTTAAIAQIQELRDIGLKVSLDDFGTGYSSLAYLTKLPLHCLKIDRAFILDLNRETGVSVVKTIIALAQALGLTTVAEGVETEEQKTLLLDFGCDVMQGYLFSKPLPAEEMTQLLRDHAAVTRPEAVKESQLN